MKIAVTSDDKSSICGHLGRCKYFLVFSVENGSIKFEEVRENSFTSHAQSNCSSGHNPGESDHSHDSVLRALGDCEVVISQGMGKRIKEDLINNEIKPVMTVENNALEAVRLFIEGKVDSFHEKSCDHC